MKIKYDVVLWDTIIGQWAVVAEKPTKDEAIRHLSTVGKGEYKIEEIFVVNNPTRD